MEDCIFCKIAGGEIKSDIKYQDERVIAFSDINPQAPVHIQVIPRKHIDSVNEVDHDIAGHCIVVARDIASKLGISKDGYRLVINCNKHGGQEVGHLHVHLLGGRQMKWPPG